MKKGCWGWILMVCLLLAGCQMTSNEEQSTMTEEQHVKLIVTQGFGQHILVNEERSVKSDATVFDVLEANVELETKGDGFIEGINGVKSDRGGMGKDRQDWFYYVNGICADVGAMGYTLSPNDVIWWDYHPWKAMGSANAAVVGAYPEPFVNGYGEEQRSTILAVADGYEEHAEQLKAALKEKGVFEIQVKKINEIDILERTGPTIVIGEWKALNVNDALKDLNKAYMKTGVNMYFDADSVNLLDDSGEAVKVILESCGVIAATGSGLGDETPLWLLSGNDQAGTEMAVSILLETPEELALHYGIAVTNDGTIALPVYEGEH